MKSSRKDVRVFTKDEWTARMEKRRKGELPEPPPADLAPIDAPRKRMRFCITVPRGIMTIARRAGDGNASKGIEKALLHWQDCPRKRREK